MIDIEGGQVANIAMRTLPLWIKLYTPLLPPTLNGEGSFGT